MIGQYVKKIKNIFFLNVAIHNIPIMEPGWFALPVYYLDDTASVPNMPNNNLKLVNLPLCLASTLAIRGVQVNIFMHQTIHAIVIILSTNMSYLCQLEMETWDKYNGVF